ncbi:aminoglycoside phosphotransferase [Streptomyces sp. NBC_01465]|uniref:aminoglycoside phosphotransferase n=1 Tax=Streptomyces sp. NBC_01465 TaxID=2903878 RepID=UPI002E3641B1|nr:aminoglycoside phosphotransferase [Streptomyces sp. NBC_01465]
MPAAPIAFDDLPSEVRTAIEAEIGEILKIENISTGLNSSLSARAYTDSGTTFLKGLRTDHRWVWTQQREADINPYVTPLAPRLLFHVIADGWNILGFEAIDGRHANYSRGSRDLPKVIEAMRRLGDVPCPDIELRQAEQRLSGYVDNPADAEAFKGDALLHTDWNNHNVLVADDRAHLVDWGWATCGAAWLDPAHWIIWLIAAGHTPEEAEAQAAKIAAWDEAPVEGVNAFAAASARLWTEIAGRAPDAWTGKLQSGARKWDGHRNK